MQATDVSVASSAGNGRAAVWKGLDEGFAVVDVALPSLADGEVLVKVSVATVCGSDVHTTAGDRATPIPTVLGHEAVGEVVAVGDGARTVSGRQPRPGQNVSWTIGTACGSCDRCRKGVPQKCHRLRKYGHERMTPGWNLNGGFATHCHLLAGTGIVELPDHLPDVVAAPANCATATIVCAMRRGGLDDGDSVVIQGCGMLGLTAIAYAKEAGAGRVIGCDVAESRRAAAREFGADAVSGPEDLDATVQTLLGDSGADLVIEASGNSSAVQSSLPILGVNGRLVLVGSVSPAPEIAFEPSSFVRNLSSIVGTHNYSTDDLVEAVDFLSRRADLRKFTDLVPHTFSLDRIAEAMDKARSGGAPRVAVAM